MRPGKGADRPSCLAMEPRNAELSVARRVKLLASFNEMDEDTQADLLEAAENWAFTGFVDYDKRDARNIFQKIYEKAGWAE